MYKYAEIVELLKAECSTLPAGTKVASRTALCRRYNISKTTVDRVMKTLEKEGIIVPKVGSGSYVSPTFAQESRSKQGVIYTWGVVMPNIMTNSFPGILRGIEDVAGSKGINTIICNTDYSADREYEYIQRLTASGVHGLIIIPPLYYKLDMKGYNLLLKNNIPFIFCNRGIDELNMVPLVSCNNYYGGYIATKHLIEKGYRHIGFLSAIRFQTSMCRLNGYCAALMEAGIDVDYDIVFPQTATADERDVRKELKTMLTSKNPPDALFCHNDVIASQVYEAAADLGIAISDSLGVIGFDNNVEICLSQTPPLTSITFQDYDIGKLAATILYETMLYQKRSSSNVYLFQPEIVLRESCLGPSNTFAIHNMSSRSEPLV